MNRGSGSAVSCSVKDKYLRLRDAHLMLLDDRPQAVGTDDLMGFIKGRQQVITHTAGAGVSIRLLDLLALLASQDH